jgi:hypothetical protein
VCFLCLPTYMRTLRIIFTMSFSQPIPPETRRWEARLFRLSKK